MPYYGDGAMPYYYAGGPFANHSSLMTGIGRSYHNPIAARYSPHLSTISETPFVTLRRYSPAVTGTTTTTSLSRPRRTIDTADIDVSKPPRSLTSENRQQRHRLRRDRPTIKIRSQALKDNPALREYNERHEKTVGELLVEKFLIKDKNDQQEQPARMRLYHQASLQPSMDEPASAKERDNEILAAIRRRVTRRMTRRRSSADVQPLDPEQIEREAAFQAIQAEALDSLVAEEQKEIEVEMRRGTFAKRQAMRLAAAQPSESEEEESQETEGRRSRHTLTKKKRRRKSVERVVVAVPVVASDEEDEEDEEEESVLEIPESVMEEDEEEEEEFEWDDRDKCDDVRKLIPMKVEDGKLGKVGAVEDLKVDTTFKKDSTIVGKKELACEKSEKKEPVGAKGDKKEPINEKIQKEPVSTKIPKKDLVNSEIKKEPVSSVVEKKEPTIVKDRKEPVSAKLDKKEAVSTLTEKKEPVTISKNEINGMTAKKEPVIITKKETGTSVTEKKETVSLIKKEPITTPTEKKGSIVTKDEKKEPEITAKKEPVSKVPEKESVIVTEKEPVNTPTEKNESVSTAVEKKEPATTIKEEPVPTSVTQTEKKELEHAAKDKITEVAAVEKKEVAPNKLEKHVSETRKFEKQESLSPKVEKKEPESPKLEKRESVSPKVEKKEPESPKLEKRESVSPKVEKKEPGTPKLEKQESATPKYEKQESVSPKVEKKEPVTPKVEKQESATPKHEKKEPVTPKLEKQEPVTPKVEKKELVSPKIEKQETSTPKYEKKEAVTPKLEKQEPVTSKLEKQEQAIEKCEKEETVSPKLEKQEPVTPKDEKKEPTTAKPDKKPKSPKKRDTDQGKLKRTVSAPLDDSPCFKVEACNSVGDFSTLFVRAAEAPARSIEQFRESIRLPAPRRPQAPTHIETEVVLPVRRPYVRDTSRNSVYLALKPSQRPALEDTRKALAEEEEEEVNAFDRRPRPAKVDARRSISDAEAADRPSAPSADEFVAWWDETEEEAASKLLTKALKVEAKATLETLKKGEIQSKEESSVSAEAESSKVVEEEAKVAPTDTSEAREITEEAKVAEVAVDKVKEESKLTSSTEKKSEIKPKEIVEESVPVPIPEKKVEEAKKAKKIEELKVSSPTERKPLVNKAKELLPSSPTEKKVEKSKEVEQPKSSSPTEKEVQECTKVEQPKLPSPTDKKIEELKVDQSKPSSPTEKKLLPNKSKVTAEKAVPDSPTEKKIKESETKVISEKLKVTPEKLLPLDKSVTAEESKIVSPTDKKSPKQSVTPEQPRVLSPTDKKLQSPVQSVTPEQARVPSPTEKKSLLPSEPKEPEEKKVTIEIKEAKPTSPEAIPSTEPKATSDSTKSTPDKKTTVEKTQSVQEAYPLSGERPILARREKTEERKGRVIDAEAVMKIEKRILEEAESPCKILTGAIPEAARPAEKVGLATKTTKKSEPASAAAAGTEIDFWSEIKDDGVSGKAQSGLRLECVLDSARPAEEDEDRTPLAEEPGVLCNGRPEVEEPPTPTNDPEELSGTVKKISKWGNRDNLADLEADADATPVVSASSSVTSTTKKKLVKRKKSTATGKKKADGDSTKSKTSTRKAAAKKTAASPQPPAQAVASTRNTPAQRPADLAKMFYTTPAILLTATPRDLRKVRRAKVKRKKPPTRTPSLSSDSTGSTRSTATTTSTEEGSNCEEDTEQKRLASTRSNDSGFDGSPRLSNCDMVCHKKCEKLTGNLCGLNQKLVAEALQALKKAPSQSSENQRNADGEHYHHSGRITPPATNLPRFKKYEVTDFNFLKVLGKGSFGKVLLAELRGTECVYAVKCLKKDVVLEDDDVECTLIERKVLTLATRHPYLCHLFCTFQTESHLFFVMEYLNGGDLMFHIQKSGRFSEARAKFYAAEIWSGLIFLHKKGIVYRDLKLDNVLLDFEGHIRIADFGMCKLQIFLDRTADTFCGTPDYMAPEIIKGLKYNQAVDWWSFGVLLYEMLTGQSPFSGCDEDELFWSICNERPFIPRYLSQSSTDILVCLLEKDAGKRIPGHEIACHPFFCTIAWDKLERRSLEPPFKPAVEHTLDTRYFDTAFTTERPRLTPVPEQILTSMDQAVFRGFSYTNPNATD